MTLPASGAISFSNINTELCRSSTAQLSMNCSSVRTLFGQASGAICMNTGHGKSNTTVPGAPTGVGGSATSSSAVSVTFSAPASNGGLSIDLYQAISSPGCITATAASSPISVTGLSPSTSYTFRVRAHNSKGYGCYSSASGSITTQSVRGCAVYTTPGTYTWTAPTGVTSTSSVVVGGGANGSAMSTYTCNCSGCTFLYGGQGGGAGALAYKSNISVSPGTGYTVVVGPSLSYYQSKCAAKSYFISSGTVAAQGGQQYYYCTAYTISGDGGGGGGGPKCGGVSPSGGDALGGGGGGGAGGYAGGGGSNYGRGGRGHGYNNGASTSGTDGYTSAGGGGGGGAGEAYGANFNGGVGTAGGGGGGVGLYGQGSTGSGGSAGGGGGGGGSGGANGSTGNGGSYGGGGGGAGGHYYAGNGGQTSPGSGASGAVRIVWPGSSRQFPSTDVGA